ncbi:MAG: T9SS type A sorting domain-containing protein [Bacteroidia bacterium]
MKKIFTIIVMAFTLKAATSGAQIPNSGFENLATDGTISNWMNYPISFFAVGDSIICDNFFFCYDTSDAHQGMRAMVLNNVWDYTANIVFPAKVNVLDTTPVFLGSPVFISTQSALSQWGPLFNFSFYYKYLPANGDSAFAQITLTDSMGNVMGSGILIITDSTNSYTLANVPITYTIPGNPDFYNITFSTFYEASPGAHQPGYNTRLFVDDVTFNNPTAVTPNPGNNNEEVKIYPNPAGTQLTVKTKTNADMQFYIYNVDGQAVMHGSLPVAQSTIRLETLSAGFYAIELTASGKTVSSGFVIKK